MLRKESFLHLGVKVSLLQSSVLKHNQPGHRAALSEVIRPLVFIGSESRDNIRAMLL